MEIMQNLLKKNDIIELEPFDLIIVFIEIYYIHYHVIWSWIEKYGSCENKLYEIRKIMI
jgi:hypothetical protein